MYCTRYIHDTDYHVKHVQYIEQLYIYCTRSHVIHDTDYHVKHVQYIEQLYILHTLYMILIITQKL